MHGRIVFCLCLLAPLWAHGDEIEVSATIASNLRSLAAYRIHHGRITVDTGHFAGGLTMTGPTPSRKERLVMHALDGDAMIHYQQSSWREEISLRLTRNKAAHAWDVELLRRPAAQSRAPSIWFVQRGREQLLLRSSSITCEQANFWQLWLAEPELCREQLWPLLKVLRPDWPLPEEALEVQRLSQALAHSKQPAQQQQWQQLVDELASDRAREREHAFRSLLGQRPTVLVFLKRLPLEQLDAEQRLRVQKVLSAAQPEWEDTPVSAAVELAE